MQLQSSGVTDCKIERTLDEYFYVKMYFSSRQLMSEWPYDMKMKLIDVLG